MFARLFRCRHPRRKWVIGLYSDRDNWKPIATCIGCGLETKDPDDIFRLTGVRVPRSG